MWVTQSKSVLRKFPQVIKTLSEKAGGDTSCQAEQDMKARQWWKDWERNTGCDSRPRGAHWGAAERTGRNKNKNLLGEDNVVKVPALQRKLSPNISRLANGVRRGGSSRGTAPSWRKGLWKTGKSDTFVCATHSVSLFTSVTLRQRHQKEELHDWNLLKSKTVLTL